MSLLSNYENNERPWGTPERFTANEASTVKLLHVKPGQRFSLQKHAKRSEFWRVVEGSGTLTLGSGEREFKKGDTAEIPAGTEHRLAASDSGLIVLEIAFGEYDENDISRLADDYGRAEHA